MYGENFSLGLKIVFAPFFVAYSIFMLVCFCNLCMSAANGDIGAQIGLIGIAIMLVLIYKNRNYGQMR